MALQHSTKTMKSGASNDCGFAKTCHFMDKVRGVQPSHDSSSRISILLEADQIV